MSQLPVKPPTALSLLETILLDSQRFKAHDTAAPSRNSADLLVHGLQENRAKKKKHEDAEHNPLATCIADPEEVDDDNMPFSYVPEDTAAKEASQNAGDRADAAAEEVVQNTGDDAEAAAGVGQGGADQVGARFSWLKLACGMCWNSMHSMRNDLWERPKGLRGAWIWKTN